MMSVGLNFHHVGYACLNLDLEERNLRLLGYQREGPDFDDPLQEVHGRFLVGPGPRIELLVQHRGAKVLTPWLSKSIKIYHLAYEVKDLEFEIGNICKGGAKLVVPPVSSVAFGGKEISFLLLPNLLLIELIQL